MQTLLLLRHAHAELQPYGGNDCSRPLSTHGRVQALQVKQWFLDCKLEVDRVLCSPAIRTRETCQLVLDTPVNLEYVDAIYSASCEQLLSTLEQHMPYSKTLLLVGHNPGLSELASYLTQQNCALSPATILHLTLTKQNNLAVGSAILKECVSYR